MSPITTHVLDTARGKPAEGIIVRLDRQDSDGAWIHLAQGATNRDGRIASLLPDDARLDAGVYRLRFLTDAYFASLGVRGFYPEVPVHFHYNPVEGHYHVPLLLSPFGFSTYRGS